MPERERQREKVSDEENKTFLWSCCRAVSTGPANTALGASRVVPRREHPQPQPEPSAARGPRAVARRPWAFPRPSGPPPPAQSPPQTRRGARTHAHLLLRCAKRRELPPFAVLSAPPPLVLEPRAPFRFRPGPAHASSSVLGTVQTHAPRSRGGGGEGWDGEGRGGRMRPEQGRRRLRTHFRTTGGSGCGGGWEGPAAGVRGVGSGPPVRTQLGAWTRTGEGLSFRLTPGRRDPGNEADGARVVRAVERPGWGGTREGRSATRFCGEHRALGSEEKGGRS